MAVAQIPEQALHLQLERIQQAIANKICIGALFPDKRRQCAEQVCKLEQEAERIAQNPHKYRINEPWEINDPDDRHLQIELTVNSVFRMAPEDQMLVDSLIEHWKEEMEQTATQGKQAEWDKQHTAMRNDADSIHTTRLNVEAPDIDYDRHEPKAMVYNLQNRLAKLAEKSTTKPPKNKSKPWLKARAQAMQQINQRAIWLLQETDQLNEWTDQPEDNRPQTAIKFHLREEYARLHQEIEHLETAG